MKRITYGKLFKLLGSLGFRENRPKKTPLDARVFFHEQTDTILAYRRGVKESVTPADMLSTDVHLYARGLVEEPLETLLSRPSAKA